MILQDRPQPVREHKNLRDRGQSGVYPAVDLGEHGVEDKIVELLLAADVAVLQATKGRGWRPGQHHDASGTAAAEAVQTAH